MTLHEMTARIPPPLRAEAEALLASETFVSLKDFTDGYEAFIVTQDGVLLLEVVLDSHHTVLEYGCQCRRGIGLCVHAAATLLGIEAMLSAGDPDKEVTAWTHSRTI